MSTETIPLKTATLLSLVLLQVKPKLTTEQLNIMIHCVRSTICSRYSGSRICKVAIRMPFTTDKSVVETEYRIASDLIVAIV